jgi:hypothetical protein
MVLNEPSCYHLRVLDPRLPLRCRPIQFNDRDRWVADARVGGCGLTVLNSLYARRGRAAPACPGLPK